MSDESRLDVLLESIDKREKKQTRATSLFVLISVALAVGLLLITARQVKQAGDDVARLEQERKILDGKVAGAKKLLDTLEEQRDDAKADLDAAKIALDLSTKRLLKQREETKLELESLRYVDRARHKIDMLDLKGAQRHNSPKGMAIWRAIARAEKARIEFSVRAQGPRSGYNSPNFAAHILKQLGHTSLPEGDAYDYFLSRPSIRGKPTSGDLVLYETGYSLFYLIDNEKKPFVYGMTPLGIAALKYNFAKPKRIVRSIE